MLIVPSLILTADMVLRGQGADPEKIRARRPDVIAITQQAIEIGSALLQPRLFQKRVKVVNEQGDTLLLEDGDALTGPFVPDLLHGAEELFILALTIGDEVEVESRRILTVDPPLGMALDGFGTAATELFGRQVTNELEALAGQKNWSISTPVSPGSITWPVDIGQPWIFKQLQPDPAVLRVTSSGQMIPAKSISMLIAAGNQLPHARSTCESCSSRDRCLYRQHF